VYYVTTNGGTKKCVVEKRISKNHVESRRHTSAFNGFTGKNDRQ